MPLTIAAIVCAYNESRFLAPCLYSLKAQTRPPDEIIVVDNASTDDTGALARIIPGVRVLLEPTKGLVTAREAARRAAQAGVLAYLDADCRAPIWWIERIENRFSNANPPVTVTGPYQFHGWDWSGRARVGLYDRLVAPPTHRSKPPMSVRLPRPETSRPVAL